MSSTRQSRKKHKQKKTKSKRNGIHSNKYSKSEEKKSSKLEDDEQDSSSEEATTRIWVCSWNMAAKDHFKFKTTYDNRKIPDSNQTQKLEQIVPTNYDLYIFGVQEGVSDTFFKYISLYLKEFDVQRISLSASSSPNPKQKKSMNRNANCFGVHGRGDGSFINTKFTGIAVYFRKNLSPFISLKSCAAVSCGITQGSKGAACILLKIYSSTIAFLSTHMSSNSTDAKLEHFKILVNKTGDTLGCHGFDLLTQFHHIIWFGDLNYRIETLTADNVLQNMALGNLNKIWANDSLRLSQKMGRSKGRVYAFKGFKEPVPRLDFYPTYKKKPNRQLDFDQNPKELQNMSASSQQSSLSQLDKIYTTKYKEPFYKGGTVQDRIPSFCDRVLYHSLGALTSTLECELDTGVLNCVEFSYKKDKCNNYGCIPHHLMGSDHSAIYCGLTLKSQMLFPCPPHELNDQGLPKSYQLKIEDIKIMRKSPYHSDSTYSEFPVKTKVLFPAPYEIENFKYTKHKPYAHTILQQDLEMYHHILRQMTVESKRRLSKNRFKKNKISTQQHRNRNTNTVYPLLTPQHTPLPSHRHKGKGNLPHIFNDEDQDTLISAKPVVDKGLNAKKMKKNRDKIHGSDDDDWDMPTYDILSNNQTQTNGTKNGTNKGKRDSKGFEKIRASTVTNITEPRSNTQTAPKSPNRMIETKPKAIATSPTASNSEYFADIDPNQDYTVKPNTNYANNSKPNSPNIANKRRQSPNAHIYRKPQTPNKKSLPNHPPPDPPNKHHRNSTNNTPTPTTPAQLSPKYSTTSPANGDEGGAFTFSMDYNDNKSFNLSEAAPPVPTTPKPDKRNSVVDRVNKTKHKRMNKGSSGGIAKDNPLSEYLSNNTKNDTNTNFDAPHIRDDHFEYKSDEDVVSPIHFDMDGFGQSPSSGLQRTRSKSMGSFADTLKSELDNESMIIETELTAANNLNSKNMKGHTVTRSDLNNRDLNGQIPSPIYKDLSEVNKRLTVISFGPSRRPTIGHIHCVLRVETNEFKGQCTIPFQWTDFSNEVEGTQFAELSYHGVPLYDKTGSPVRCKVHYKLSLIDKQIVFENY